MSEEIALEGKEDIIFVFLSLWMGMASSPK